MNRFTLLLLTIVMLLSACSTSFELTDSHGNIIHLSDYRGKWVFIHYWASWCKPCMKDIPAFNALFQGNHEQVMVLGVSYDKLSAKKINQVAQQQSIQYPMLATFPLKKMGIPHLNVLPITFVVNPKGQLVKTLPGPQSEAQLKKAMTITRG